MNMKKMLCALLTLCLVFAMLPLSVMAAEEVIATGTINVTDSLNVREGPGTGYAVVGTLGSGDRVEIYEIRTVDGVEWGRIDMGWISMAYVELDPPISDSDNSIGSGGCGLTMSWTLTENGVLTVTGTGEMQDYKMKSGDPNISTAPWADYGDRIKALVIETGVTDIGDYAFYNCKGITSISLPEGLVTLGTGAFMNCSGVTEITLPESLRELGPVSMQGMSALTELAIPAATTVIGEDALNRLSSLKGFQVAAANPNYSSDMTGTLFSKDKTVLIAFPGAYEGAYVIPAGVQTITRIAFDTCLGVTEVEIPGSVTDIEMMAFTYCKNLTKIHFKGDAPTISGDAFNCLNTVVYYPAGNETWTEDVMRYYMGDIVLWEPVGDCVHTAEEGVVTQEPGCKTPGYMTYTCTTCGADFYEIIPGLDHAWDEGVRSEEYNCEEGGFIRYTCSGCLQYYTETLEPTDHIYDDGVVVAPTCTQQGCTQYTCTVCGYVNSVDPVDAVGHTLVEEEVFAPSCTSEGFTLYICSVCGDEVFDDYVEATGHTYEDVVTLEPTCTDDGELTYTCSACGDSYTEAIPALGHSYDDGTVTTDPTCTEEGVKTFTCTVCGDTYTEAVPVLEHSYDEGTVTAEPTCTEEGVKTFTCTVCGDTYTEAVPALGHTLDAGTVTIEPTCTTEGESAHPCTVCGEIITDVLPALGHSWDEGTVVTEPTCTTTGLISYICSVCLASSTEEIPMIPHDFVDGFCSVCNAAQMTAPQILSCYSKEQTSVKVTWTTVEGADGYWLWRSTTPEDYNSWTKVKTINDGTVDRYTNQGLTEGVTYYYAVQAFLTTSDGEVVTSEYSNMAYMPAAVVFDGPYSNATFRIRLRWNEVGGAHGYQIWRQNEDGTYSIVKTLGDRGNELTDNQGATTAYSNTGLTAGETYTYKMRAFMITEDGRKVFGAYSDEYTVAVMPEAPVLTGTSPKAARAQLTWDAPNGAAGYQIWMAESEDGEYQIAKSITDGSTTYTKYDLTSGKTYCFKVRAYTEVEGKKTFGDYSETVSIKVK